MTKTKIFYDFEATSVARDADPISVGLIAVTEKEVDVPVKGKYARSTEIHQEIKSFYAEFTDSDLDKADYWVKENIIDNLPLKFSSQAYLKKDISIQVLGDSNTISIYLKEWLSQFEEVEFWADFDVIDKPMLIDLIADWDYNENQFDTTLTLNPPIYKPAFSHKIGLPKHLPNVKYYDFYDLHTLFKDKGVDPDIERERYAIQTDAEWVETAKEATKLDISSNGEANKHNALWDAYISWKCYQKLQ